MLYGRKCPPTETIYSFIIRILLLIFTLAVCFLLKVNAQQTSSDKSINLNLPLKMCWSFPLENINAEVIASDNNTAFFSVPNSGKIYLINTVLGNVEWQNDLGGQINSSSYVFADGLFLITKKDKDYTVWRLNKETGLTVWQSQLNFAVQGTKLKFYLYSYKDSLIVAADDGSIRMLSSKNGRIEQSLLTGEKLVTQVYIKDGYLSFGTDDQRVIILSLDTFAKAIHLIDLPVPFVTSAVLTSENNLIWGDVTGTVHLSDQWKSSTGEKLKEKWRFRTGGKISSLVMVERNSINRSEKEVLISSLDNFVYLISERTGKLVWKKRMSGRIIYAPQIYKEYIILTSIDDNSASIIDINSGKTINRIDPPRENLFTGIARVDSQFILLSGTKGLFAFTTQTQCKN